MPLDVLTRYNHPPVRSLRIGCEITLDIKELKATLTETELVSAAQLDSLLADLPEDDLPADGEALLRLLIAQEIITFYQGQVLLRGKGRSLRLGKYLIQNKLGQGGMGMVFHAKHVSMKREVALKVVSGKVASNSELMQRFQREVQATAKLHHPNIVVAHDASEDRGTAYLVMEYIEGKDLSAIVKKKGPLTISQAINMIRQTALGLEYAHAQGVIHRDIKPSNLFLDHSGNLKILDMGLARFEDEEAAELTATGAVMGTIDYMAPEQALSTKDANAQSDVYSLGCTLWYLLLAKPMYGGESMIAKVLAHRSQPTPSLLDEREDFPEELQAIFEKMVAKKPENRYASMSELLADLDKFKSGDSELTAFKSSFTSDEDQLDEFLELTGAAAAPPQGAAKTKSRSVPTMSDVDSDQEFQTFMMPPVVGRPTRVNRKKQSAWYQDWRVLSLSGAALALVMMIVLFAGGSGGSKSNDAPEPDHTSLNANVPAVESKADSQLAANPDPVPTTPPTSGISDDPKKLKNEVLAPDSQFTQTFKQEIYEFLIEQPELSEWKPLPITSMKTAHGSILTGQPDGSVLASGENVGAETYEVTVSSSEPEIHAIRLEALPHESLPKNGPGRHESGNFQIDGFHVFRGTSPAISSQPPIPFSQAFADYEYFSDDVQVESIIDDQRDRVWHIWGRVGMRHVAIFVPAEPIRLTPGLPLTIRISHPIGQDDVNLGCFRLMTCSAPLDVRNEKLLMALREHAIDESLSASAACLIKGHPQQARQYLERDQSRPTTDPQFGTQILIQILISMTLGEQDQTGELQRQLIEWLEKYTFDRTPLRSLALDALEGLEDSDRETVRRSMMYHLIMRDVTRFRAEIERGPAGAASAYYFLSLRLSQLGRWQEAADVDLAALKHHPENEFQWMRAAVHLLMAGNADAYRELCEDFVKEYGKPANPLIADRVCKICLLKPDVIPLAKLPSRVVQQGLNVNYYYWLHATMALGAYREKKYRDCISLLKNPSESSIPALKSLAILIRAMAEFQTRQTVQARESYREAEFLIPAELRALRLSTQAGAANYLSVSSLSHDWLISEILRREAEALIFPNQVRNAVTLKKTLSGHSGNVFTIVYSPDGKLLASGGVGEVRVWDVESGAMRYALPLIANSWYLAIAFSPDSKYLLTAPESRDSAGLISLWDAETGKSAGALEGHRQGLYALSFSPDGKSLASGGWDNFVRLWDFEKRRKIQDIAAISGGWTRSAIYSNDGKVALGQDKVYLFKSNGKLLKSMEISAAPPLYFSPDNRHLAGTSWQEGLVTVWDATTGDEVVSWKAHQGTANGVCYSRNSRVLATAGGDQMVRLWDPATQLMLAELPHDAEVYGVTFSPDGNTLASCGYDYLVKLWDVSQLPEMKPLKPNKTDK